VGESFTNVYKPGIAIAHHRHAVNGKDRSTRFAIHLLIDKGIQEISIYRQYDIGYVDILVAGKLTSDNKAQCIKIILHDPHFPPFAFVCLASTSTEQFAD
jgi:hypothetical protein